jgi:hypothetical protein
LLLYWYKSTNTDAEGASVTCFTGTKVPTLTLKAVQLDPRYVPALLTYGVLLCQLDRFGTRFSRFTGTKVQILAQKALLADAETCFTSTKAALLVQKYIY